MDQYVAAFARPGHAVLLDCRTLEGTSVPLLLEDSAIVVLDSRVKHDLATSAYNERRGQCDEGVRKIAAAHPSVQALRDVTPELLAEYQSVLEPAVYHRCRHVVRENARTLEAALALRRGDLPRVGALMLESHESLRCDYEVSCKELDFLVDAMRRRSGVYGARMTGGGFGGCVIGLVESAYVREVVEGVSADYEAQFGRVAQTFVTRPSEGAREELDSGPGQRLPLARSQ
jgi:galactokinase